LSNLPILLCILDGFGIGDPKDLEHNAIQKADTPFWNYLLNNYPNTEIETSGEAVGLPEGQMGNSEVGHMAIGSGRIVFQDLIRINQAINSGALANNQELQALINHGGSVHLLGLASDGGVHSHIDHLIFLAKLLAQHNLEIKLHLFLDGRDVSPSSASAYLSQIDILTQEHKNIKIATISGRFYSMDRDQRLQRTELACDAILNAKGNKIDNWQDYLQKQYQQNIYDEFIVPASFIDYEGMKEDDSIIFTNFRSDRVRQLAQEILVKRPNLTYKIGMTHYSDKLSKQLFCLFPEQKIQNCLAEILSKHNMKQLHVAETEKYAHVTFFFNGGREEPYLGEDRILVPSPKVETYDLAPEMSAYQVTEEIVNSLDKYDFIVVNYANGDMVGHTGKMDAAIKAIETLDKCLEKLYQAITKIGGVLIITADHGNAEHMFDEDNNLHHTSHTLNPVPFVLVSKKFDLKQQSGNLSDVAPTILQIMGVKQPAEMTGKSLIKDNHEKISN
jgi:2,3-bisphosphoglycerate-independent phosphoglycerate mutase